jgi:Kef-type K+ transport system membrane component KefB
VLQTLNEKSLLKTAGGQGAFAVLLFQDVAVIPMPAVFPLLATANAGAASGEAVGAHVATTWIGGLPPWAQTLAVLGAVAAIGLGGRYLMRPTFRAIKWA